MTAADRLLSRAFPLPVVLSLTTGLLMCPLDELHALLDHLTGDELMTHQLPRAADEVMPAVLAQRPWLPTELPAEVKAVVAAASGDDARQVCLDWVATVAAVHGGEVLLTAAPTLYERRNPLVELAERVGAERMIIVAVEEPEVVGAHARETTYDGDGPAAGGGA